MQPTGEHAYNHSAILRLGPSQRMHVTGLTAWNKLRSLELEFPPLKYKIVCNNEELYTTIVQGFLRDIAGDSDYDIFAVNNWWDDLEKFGAVSARFLAIRHGLRMKVEP